VYLVAYQKLTFQENISVYCVKQIQLAAAIGCSFSLQFVHACAMHLLLPDFQVLRSACWYFLLLARKSFWALTSPIWQRKTLRGPSRHRKKSNP
jgi:hypothetical protein